MDKRKKKTTYNQYMVYIQMLEEDEIFRGGILTRDADPNYLTTKWVELAKRLNDCSGGPTLSSDEWKKRLNDWKNSTRAKFRKISDQPVSRQDKVLTPLEQKALALWGTTPKKLNPVVEDRIDQKKYPVVKIESVEILNGAVGNEYDVQDLSQDNEEAETEEESEVHFASTPKIEEIVDDENAPSKRLKVDDAGDQNNTNYVENACKSIRNDKLQELAVQLKRIANVKEEKLKFEIAKFKFRNPGFEYELNIGD